MSSNYPVIRVSLAHAALLCLLVARAHAATFNVTVGGLAGIGRGNSAPIPVIAFNPNFLTAASQDQIRFTFQQGNHTATQSSLGTPCEPVAGEFDIGFINVETSSTNGPFPEAILIVQDLEPVWIFCEQAGHCQQGMVFAINPAGQWDSFLAAAKSGGTTTPISAMLTPSPTAQRPSATDNNPTKTATFFETTGWVEVPYSSYPGSAAPTSGSHSDHLVVVGDLGQLVFNPPHLTAQLGDTITFQFLENNHSVTQSSFERPCTPIITDGNPGFDSGFQPILGTSSPVVNFTVHVNDTTLMWAFCGQTSPVNHCVQGMVFAANTVETTSRSFSAFQQRALQSAQDASNSNGSLTPVPPSSMATTNVPWGPSFFSVTVTAFLILLVTSISMI